jgi:hypothetical protein
MKKIAFDSYGKKRISFLCAAAARTDTRSGIYNTLDDFLSIDANARGEFTRENLNRLLHIVKSAEMSGADIVWQPAPPSPPGSICCAACWRKACRNRRRNGALRARCRNPFCCDGNSLFRCRPFAGNASGRWRSHRTKNRRFALCCATRRSSSSEAEISKGTTSSWSTRQKQLGDADAILLAQASMAHLQDKVERASCIKTYSSPDLCIQKLKHFLSEQN